MFPQTLFLLVAGLASATPLAAPEVPAQGLEERWAILPDTPADEVTAIQAGQKRWAILPDTPADEVTAIQAGQKRWAILPDTPADEVAAIQAGKRQLGAVLPLRRTGYHSNAKRDPHLALMRDGALIDRRYNEGRDAKLFEEDMARLTKRAGEVGVTDYKFDNTYSGEISVGNPGQMFQVVLDTGSADLWIQESNCTNCDGDKFNRGVSTSFSVPDGSPAFRINYGSGSVTGNLGRDDVALAGYRVVNQTFGVVDEGSHILGTSGQGILGLAFKSLSNAGATPWWVTSSTKWPQSIFAFYLRRWRNNDAATGSDDGGKLTLGYLDNSLYQGDVHYTKLLENPRYWAIPMAKLSVGDQEIDLQGKPNVAIDTGTTDIMGPEEVVTQIYAKIPNARASSTHHRYWEYPCNQTVDNVKVTFGDYDISMASADFNAGEVTDRPGWCLGTFYMGRVSANNPVSWIVGASLLKNAYTVFDNTNLQVGFAQLADGLNAPSGGSGGNATKGQQLLPSHIPAAQPEDDTAPVDLPSASAPAVTDDQAVAAASPDPSSTAEASSTSGSGSSTSASSASETSSGAGEASSSSSSAAASGSSSPSASSAEQSSAAVSSAAGGSSTSSAAGAAGGAQGSSAAGAGAGTASGSSAAAKPSESAKSAARALVPSLGAAVAALGLSLLL